MEKITAKVVSSKGKELGGCELNPFVFSVPCDTDAVYQTVRWQRARQRSGTHATLTRSMMKGGGKKPFKQKGTGRARAGSNISPLWVGGAVVFGPQPRSYGGRITKSTRHRALASVLTDKAASGTLIVVDSIDCSGKTREVAEMLRALGVADRSVTVIADDATGALRRACRNIEGLVLLSVAQANVFDIARQEYLVVAKSAIEALQGRVVGTDSVVKGS